MPAASLGGIFLLGVIALVLYWAGAIDHIEAPVLFTAGGGVGMIAGLLYRFRAKRFVLGHAYAATAGGIVVGAVIAILLLAAV